MLFPLSKTILMTLIKILDNKTSDSSGDESADDEDDDVCFELQGASTSANPVIWRGVGMA